MRFKIVLEGRINMNTIKQLIPTKLYIEMMYFHHFHKFCSFSHPKTMNEKVQWIKVNYQREDYISIVDKVTVKDYVAGILGDKYIIPTIGVWDNADLIQEDDLPDQFVLKCNHDSHCVFICNDKKTFDFGQAKKKLNERLQFNEYWYGREWPYRYVQPKILAEKLLKSDSGEVADYKLLCINGVPENIMMCAGRQSGKLRYYFFDRNWHFLKVLRVDKDLPDDFTLPKPEHLDEMFEVARILSKDFPFVRVDLYDTEGQVWFGELTFYPSAGFDTDYLPEVDRMYGEKMVLPPKVKLKHH